VDPTTIRATNFRSLERIEWTPQGLCLLAGANGAGKSTVLDALRFLRELFRQDHESAFRLVGGNNFRRHGAPREDPVVFDVSVGNLRWKLRFPMSDDGLRGSYGEELYHGDEVVLRAAMFQDVWYLGKRTMEFGDRCCARTLWDQGESPWMAPLVAALTGIQVYGTFDLDKVKQPQQADIHTSALHPTGENLWSVLANWKSAPLRYRGQFDWVVARARAAFPDIMGTIEIDRGQPFLFRPGASDPADGLPPSRAADGLLTGLLQLTALASAKEGSIIAFDEIENQLHPHAIRSILASARARAESHGLTVIVTTHSPVVMNTFRSTPTQFYVLQPGQSVQPVPITELHDEDWLAAFELGDLYDRMDFAAPLGLPKAPTP
jgi:predicted ATPase